LTASPHFAILLKEAMKKNLPIENTRKLLKQWDCKVKRKIYFRKFKNYMEAERAELDFWLSLKPEERVGAVDSCLLDSLRLKGKLNESPPRLQGVCRILKRP